MQERVNRLQAEMQEKDRQLQDARSVLEKTKSELKSVRAAGASKPAATDSPAPAFLARDRVEESYATASKAMQKHLADELKNYAVEACAEFPVVMPSDEYPYHSKVVLTFRSDGGRPYRLEFPVSADATGKWTFPNSSDVAGALADSRSQDTNSPRVTQNGSTPSPDNPPVVPGQTSSETRVIDWGDGRATNNNRPDRSPPPARASGSPSGNNTPAPAMRADKDVRIHW